MLIYRRPIDWCGNILIDDDKMVMFFNEDKWFIMNLRIIIYNCFPLFHGLFLSLEIKTVYTGAFLSGNRCGVKIRDAKYYAYNSNLKNCFETTDYIF